MKQEDFQAQVMSRLAAIETGTAYISKQVDRHTTDLDRHTADLEVLKASRNRLVGVVSVVSVFASAAVAFLFNVLRSSFSDRT